MGTKKLNEQEWQGYVTKCATGAWPIPREMISDQEDWVCRAVVGRALYFKKQVEDAMVVLSTVLDEEPDMEAPADTSMSQAEHKVLCLRDIAEIVWDLAKQGEASLQYLDRAFELARSYEHPFRTDARGDIWYRRLNVLAGMGRGEEAEAEAKRMIAEERACSHAPQRKENPPSRVNPYIYFSLRFLAEQAYAQGRVADACSLFEDAFAYYPLSEAGERDVQRAVATTNPEQRYKAFKMCTTMQYLPWEKRPKVVIDRG